MIVEDWGLIDYEASVARQETYVAEGRECIVVCTHPPVVTLGRGTVLSEDVVGWTGSTVEASRGGRATYHGPNQVVIYPIVDLKRLRPARDVGAFLRSLEAVTVSCLRELGLSSAEVRASEVGGVSLTGVWVGPRKVASVGIAVRKWMTYHGVAVNVLDDPSAFRGIRPCGFGAEVMTSVEAELGLRADYESVKRLFAQRFLEAFSYAELAAEC